MKRILIPRGMVFSIGDTDFLSLCLVDSGIPLLDADADEAEVLFVSRGGAFSAS